MSNLNDGSLVVKNNVVYLHIFDVTLEKHVLDDLLLNLVLLAKPLFGCLADDLLAPKLSPMAHLSCLLQTNRAERVPEPVVG